MKKKKGVDMIGQDVKSFVAELPADRLGRVVRACLMSIGKWEVALIVANKPDVSERDELYSLSDVCGLCGEVFEKTIERGDHLCPSCPLFVGGESCYLRGTYKKIYDYLAHENHTDLGEEFLGWVKEYGEQLVAYLRELIAEVDRRAENGN